MDADSRRSFYRATGRVDLFRFGLCVLFLAVPLALLAGLFLCVTLHIGFYIVMFIPLLGGFAAGGGVAAAVYLGRCRNRWVGLVAGLFIGLLGYLSYYQMDLAWRIGDWRLLSRVDLLPRYIYFRILPDETQNIGQNRAPAGPAGDDPVKQGFQWLFFAFDAGIAVVIAPVIGWTVASRPYSERYRRWMQTFKARVTSESARILAVVLGEVPAPTLTSRLQLAPVTSMGVTGELEIDYISDLSDAPLYLTVTEIDFRGRNQGPRRHCLVRRAELTLEEGDALATAVGLPRLADRSRPMPQVGDHASGTVETLPAGEAGRVTTASQLTVSTLLQLLPVVVGLVGAVSLGILTWWVWNDWPLPASLGLIASAVLVLVGGVVYLLWFEHALPTLYLYHRLLAELRRREDPAVSPDDPDAWFVQLLPRERWTLALGRNSTDVGLLRVDSRHKVIHFEGDHARWHLPAASIVSCEVEEFTELGLAENAYNVHAVVVLRANVDGQLWEAPVRVRNTEFASWNSRERRQLARALNEAIWVILSRRKDKRGTGTEISDLRG